MPAPGQRLGEYVLLERLGTGTFGEVWRARHHVWHESVAAIKIPTDPRFVRQLQQEGAAIQRLHHPGIVKPISFDPYADPAYLVMEYVPGSSLRSVIEQGPLPAHEAVAILQQVLAALEHAHQQGVIHRDIKPENILIADGAADDGYASPGAVRVTDFGLGQVLEPAGPQSIVLSMGPGQESIVGTTRYMAPEQLDGTDVDARADVYACGAVFFELLTGRRPAGLEVPSDLNPAVPPALDEVFYRSFVRRERRYPSAQAFADALDEAMSGEPPEPPPLPPSPPPELVAMRRAPASPWSSSLVVIGLIVLIGFVTGILFWNVWGFRPRQAMVIAQPEPNPRVLELLALADEAPASRPAAGMAESVTPPSPTGPIRPWQPPAVARRVEVVNRAGVDEASAVIADVGEHYPKALPDGANVELLKVHDAVRMRRHAGDPKTVAGSYARDVIAGVNGHIMLWGIYEKLPKGRYLVVYRLQSIKPLVERNNVCFLDICQDAVTIASHRPNGRELPQGQWRSIPVEMTLDEATEVEYRLWPNGFPYAIDRIYVYRVLP